MPLLPAVLDDLALVRLRNRPASRLLQRGRVERLDAEAHRAEPGACTACRAARRPAGRAASRFERERQAARRIPSHSSRQRSRCWVKSGSRKMTYGAACWSHSRSDLVDDVRDRPRAVAGQDPVRAVSAELGAAAAREQRIAAADRPRRPLDAELAPRSSVTRSQRGNGSESRSSICSLTTMPDGISPCASRIDAPLPARR